MNLALYTGETRLDIGVCNRSALFKGLLTFCDDKIRFQDGSITISRLHDELLLLLTTLRHKVALLLIESAAAGNNKFSRKIGAPAPQSRRVRPR